MTPDSPINLWLHNVVCIQVNVHQILKAYHKLHCLHVSLVKSYFELFLSYGYRTLLDVMTPLVLLNKNLAGLYVHVHYMYIAVNLQANFGFDQK